MLLFKVVCLISTQLIAQIDNQGNALQNQQQGIELIDQYSEHFRQTGEQKQAYYKLEQAVTLLQGKFEFPSSKMGVLARSWYESVNSGEKKFFEQNLSDNSWEKFFSSLLSLGQKVGGFRPVLVSYETPQTISIYSKENKGSWVKVNLEVNSEGQLISMGVKKSVQPVDYDLRLNLTSDQTKDIVKSIAAELERNYVIVKLRSEYSQELVKRLRNGKYDNVTQGDLLADKLTKDLREISNDKHLQVIPPSRINEVRERFGLEQEDHRSQDNSEPNSELSEEHELSEDIESIDVQSITSEKLDNHIGYITIERFVFNQKVIERTNSILSDLKNSKAIIIDLTGSGGGDGEAVIDLLSYFFENPELLTGSSKSPNGPVVEVWTTPNELSKSLSSIPLYVLTSSKTISAAEAFTYHLKRKNRATIIGETTAGAGNRVDVFKMAHDFYLVNSIETSFDPEKNEGWEGTGVSPDIRTSRREALEKALSLAN